MNSDSARDHSPTSSVEPDDETDAAQVGDAVVKQLQELSEEYDRRCQERHDMGEQKYGAGTWMGIDTIEMAIEEIVDLGNYVRFTFIKLRMLQQALDSDKSTASPQPGNEMMGKDAFVSSVRRSQ
jgi:hypothetical protein